MGRDILSLSQNLLSHGGNLKSFSSDKVFQQHALNISTVFTEQR